MRKILIVAFAVSSLAVAAHAQQAPENSQVKLAGLLAQNLAMALGQVDWLNAQVASLTAQNAALEEKLKKPDPAPAPAKQ